MYDHIYLYVYIHIHIHMMYAAPGIPGHRSAAAGVPGADRGRLRGHRRGGHFGAALHAGAGAESPTADVRCPPSERRSHFEPKWLPWVSGAMEG